MLRRIEKIKVKHQLLVLICVSISVVILLQVIYYEWYNYINRKNYSKFLQITIDQLEEKASAFHTDINNIANIISFNNMAYQFANEKVYTKIELRDSMMLMIESIMLSNKDIDSIIFTNLDMIEIGVYRQEDYWVLGEIKKLRKEGLLHLDKPTHYLFENHERDRYIYAYINRSFESDDSTQEFISVIIYNANSLRSSVKSIVPVHNSMFAILDSKDNIMMSNRLNMDDQKINLTEMKREIEIDDRNLLERIFHRKEPLIHHTTVPNLGWSIVGITPTVEIVSDLLTLKQFGYVMGGIVILLLTVIGIIINKSITSPITKMARFMNSLGENYSTRRLLIRNANEIGLLAEAMNRMLDNIDIMTKKVITTQHKLYKVELAKKQAELEAFQSQMNPHFLYNTLDCVRSIALSRKIPEIVEIVTSMAKILRYSIKDSNFVKIRDEFKCIKDYLNIIQIRHHNRFAVIYKMDERIMEATIPKMILQPVVENSVFHGLEQKVGAGTLVIGGYKTADDTIVFEIEDNGKGMTADVLELLRQSLSFRDPVGSIPALPEKKSIGLINIDSRIKLLYGTDYGIYIESNPEDGTKVVIELPITVRQGERPA